MLVAIGKFYNTNHLKQYRKNLRFLQTNTLTYNEIKLYNQIYTINWDQSSILRCKFTKWIIIFLLMKTDFRILKVMKPKWDTISNV